jgi:hypothetical protein
LVELAGYDPGVRSEILNGEWDPSVSEHLVAAGATVVGNEVVWDGAAAPPAGGR